LNKDSLDEDIDIDLTGFLLNEKGTVNSEDDLIFYNNPSGGMGSVSFMGDNKIGYTEEKKASEKIVINLNSIPDYITRIVIAVTIHEAKIRKQNFGMISSAFVKVLEHEKNQVLMEYDLSEDFSLNTAMYVGELQRQTGDFSFKPLGTIFPGTLGDLCNKFGLNVID